MGEYRSSAYLIHAHLYLIMLFSSIIFVLCVVSMFSAFIAHVSVRLYLTHSGNNLCISFPSRVFLLFFGIDCCYPVYFLYNLYFVYSFIVLSYLIYPWYLYQNNLEFLKQTGLIEFKLPNNSFAVTGASFIIFNGALKSDAGCQAKLSIVEDGVMVQVTSELLSKLKLSLKQMTNYRIRCGSHHDPSQDDEIVLIEWTEDDKNVNIGSGVRLQNF